MATDFDQFPLYDPLVKKGTDKLSDIWVGSMSVFYMNLIGYLTASGFLTPQITTTQRDALKNVQNGQMIYNTTTNEIEVWQIKAGVGAWRAVTTTP